MGTEVLIWSVWVVCLVLAFLGACDIWNRIQKAKKKDPDDVKILEKPTKTGNERKESKENGIHNDVITRHIYHYHILLDDCIPQSDDIKGKSGKKEKGKASRREVA